MTVRPVVPTMTTVSESLPAQQRTMSAWPVSLRNLKSSAPQETAASRPSG